MKFDAAFRSPVMAAAVGASLVIAASARAQPEVPMGSWTSTALPAVVKPSASAGAPTKTDSIGAAAEKILAKELHVVGGKTTVGRSGRTATVLVAMGSREQCEVHMRLDKDKSSDEKSNWTATRTICRKANLTTLAALPSAGNLEP